MKTRDWVIAGVVLWWWWSQRAAAAAPGPASANPTPNVTVGIQTPPGIGPVTDTTTGGVPVVPYDPNWGVFGPLGGGVSDPSLDLSI